jgi:hypothetical protein
MFQRAQLNKTPSANSYIVVAGQGIKMMRPPLSPHIIHKKKDLPLVWSNKSAVQGGS